MNNAPFHSSCCAQQPAQPGELIGLGGNAPQSHSSSAHLKLCALYVAVEQLHCGGVQHAGCQATLLKLMSDCSTNPFLLLAPACATHLRQHRTRMLPHLCCVASDGFASNELHAKLQQAPSRWLGSWMRRGMPPDGRSLRTGAGRPAAACGRACHRTAAAAAPQGCCAGPAQQPKRSCCCTCCRGHSKVRT